MKLFPPLLNSLPSHLGRSSDGGMVFFLFFSRSNDGELGGRWVGRGDRMWAVGAACAWRSQVGDVGMSELARRGGVIAWEVENFGRLGGAVSGVLIKAQNSVFLL